MKQTSIPDLYEEPADAIIYCVTGTLKKVFPRKFGTISKGPNTGKEWSLQNFELEHEGNEIKGVLKDRQDEIPKSWQNREVIFSAFKTDKGWKGLYVFDDDYNGQITRKLKLTPTAEIALLDGAFAGQKTATPPAPQKTAAQPQGKPAQRAPQRQEEHQEEHGHEEQEQPPAKTPEEIKAQREADDAEKLAEAKRVAIKIANMQLLALSTVENYTAPRFKEVSGRELTSEEKHAWAMNLAIEMAKAGNLHRMGSRMHKSKTAPTTPTEEIFPEKTVAPREVRKSSGPDAGTPWPEGAVPHPETGEPMDPVTGEIVF